MHSEKETTVSNTILLLFPFTAFPIEIKNQRLLTVLNDSKSP